MQSRSASIGELHEAAVLVAHERMSNIHRAGNLCLYQWLEFSDDLRLQGLSRLFFADCGGHFLPLGLPAPRRAPPCVKDFKISKFLSSSFFGHWTPDTPPIKGEKCPFGVLDRVSGEFRTKCPAMD